MKPDRWSQVRELFLTVCDLPPERRAARLATVADDTIRRQVERILASSESHDSLLDAGPLTDHGLTVGDPSPSMIGVHLGRYQLVELIATGGMGAVYLARRADEQFDKRVAVKVMRPGLIDPSSCRRFRNERQTLALLEHPHIARLLDGGVADGGMPYLAMEYVEGRPVDVYCDEHHLGITSRIQLFLKVCEAVEYAHRRLVIHRDLKPGNILVDDDGNPKLLDFGIAKFLVEEGDGPAVTVTGALPMTPEYASPEQVRGEPVTTASDVYSLGVLLYELLTGHKPYHWRTRTPATIEQTIVGVEPPAPSSIVWRDDSDTTSGGSHPPATPEAVSLLRECTPGRLSRRLRGDLDNIILKAMRKEPQRRYESVVELMDDLRAYLEGRPVKARQPSLAYRGRKFAQRHAVGLTVSLVVVVSIIVMFVGIAQQGRIAARERDEALAARTEAEAIGEFLDEMLVSVRPSSLGREVTVREALDQASVRVERGKDLPPAVQASLHDTIGSSYQRLGLFDKAEPHLVEALEIRRAVLGPNNNKLIESIKALGDYYNFTGRVSAAKPLLRKALALSQEVIGVDHIYTLNTKLTLADVLATSGDLREAFQLLEEVLATSRCQGTEGQRMVATALTRMAVLHLSIGDYAAAEKHSREGLMCIHRLFGESDAAAIENQLTLAQSLYELGRVKEARAVYEEVEPLLAYALTSHGSAMQEGHPLSISILDEWGTLLFGTARFKEAEAAFRRVLDLCESLPPTTPENQEQVTGNIAGVHVKLARTLVQLGRINEAVAEARAGAELARGLPRGRRVFAATTLRRLAADLRALGQEVVADSFEQAAGELLEGLSLPAP